MQRTRRLGRQQYLDAGGRLLTQIDLVPRHELEVMIGLCMGVELEQRTGRGSMRPRAAPRGHDSQPEAN